MLQKINVPTAITQHPMGWYWHKVYRRMHQRNQMWSCVICGSPGKGKSYLACAIANLLDRSGNGKPRFDASKIFFTGTDFARWVAEPHATGSFCVVDDSGLSMGSRESMSKSLRAITKTFQSCRFLNRGIILTLPTFSMLDVQIRSLVSAYCQPTKIDYNRGITRFKFHELEVSPTSGKLYRHRLKRVVNSIHPSGYPMRTLKTMDSLAFAKAPDALIADYEARKREYLTAWNKKNAEVVSEAENPKAKVKENTFNKYYNLVNANRKKYAAVGTRRLHIDMVKIVTKHPDCGSFNARAIAGSINRELKAGYKK